MSIENKEINLLSSCMALIEQHKKPHLLCWSITLIASALLLYFSILSTLSLFWIIALSVIIIIGWLETFYVMRIGFDLNLLNKLSLLDKLPGHPDNMDSRLAALDQALMTLNLLPSAKESRSLEARLQGCMRLFKIQTALCIIQMTMLLGSVLLNVIQS